MAKKPKSFVIAAIRREEKSGCNFSYAALDVNRNNSWFHPPRTTVTGTQDLPRGFQFVILKMKDLKTVKLSLSVNRWNCKYNRMLSRNSCICGYSVNEVMKSNKASRPRWSAFQILWCNLRVLSISRFKDLSKGNLDNSFRRTGVLPNQFFARLGGDHAHSRGLSACGVRAGQQEYECEK